MMVEAESTESTWDLVKNEGKQAPTEEVVAEGLEASKKFIKAAVRGPGRARRQGRQAGRRTSRSSWTTRTTCTPPSRPPRPATPPQALTIAGKSEREDRLDEVKDAVKAQLGRAVRGREKEISAAYRSVQKKLIRQRILRDKVRIDGRGLADIRALRAEVEVLPRVHGSAIFERGETQIMGVTTLNMLRMEQQLDTLSPGDAQALHAQLQLPALQHR